MRKGVAKALLSCALAVLVIPAHAERDRDLSVTFPGVRWVESASAYADFNGDGRKDYFAMGLKGKNVIVELKLAGQAKPVKIEFAADDLECSPVNFRDGGDMPKPKLSVFSITRKDFEGLRLEFDLDGTDIFVQNGRAEGVSVPVGETDPFLFFWNAKTKRLEWLRL